jgi:ubiquinone biosynthesis UbiH/UbiF/VisC/COQ6 family hydroxylase
MGRDSISVCGTGIVGLATALALAKARLKTRLIGPHSAPGPVQADAYCPRVYAISVASQQFLAALGVWGMLDTARITPVQSMEIHGDASGQVHLQAWQAAQPTLAWIVESSEIERALQQAVQVFGIDWHDEKFGRLEPGAIITESGRRFDTGLLIGADGASSPVRAAAGIRHDSSPYGDTGLVAHLTAELPHQHAALQWFTGDSVLAFLPLPDTSQGHQASMVWSLPDNQAQRWQAMPEAERNAALEAHLFQASGGRLGRLRVRSRLFGFPLFGEKSDMVAPGVALVGDAAHRVHPLAGQGLNLGLADVQALVDVLSHKEPHRLLGDMRVLRRYRRARAEPVMAMRLAIDGLYRLFAAQSAPIIWARNAGMQWVEHAPFVKRHLIAGASGRHKA